jgi:CBS domain-containing protein
MTMPTVRQLLAEKGHTVIAVAPDSTVFDAIKLMSEKNIGALAVMEDNQLVGIFNERDYARKVILRGRASPKTSVAEVMTENPVCVYPDQTVEECMALMTDKAVRHLPVLDDSQLVGIVSIGDLVKSIIREKEFIIDQLGHYIQGGYKP